MNVTKPVTVAETAGGGPHNAAGLILAVNVTVVPEAADVGETLRVVVVVVKGVEPLTVKLTGEELDASFPLSPPYWAVTVWVPGKSVFKAKVQEPLESVQVPAISPALLSASNIIVPLGLVPVTVAVNVTLAP